MIFKGIFILLIIFSVQNGVNAAKKFKVPPVSQKILFDITDIKSLKNFIQDSYNISRTNYESFDKLTSEEKNATAHKVFRNAQSLIKDITAMQSDDESIEEFRWDKYVLSKFKPIRSEDRDKIIDLNGRIKSALKHVKFYVNKLDSSSLTYTQNYRHGNYCIHALALYEYSLEDQFRYNTEYDSTDLMDVDNVRQLFFDLTDVLSKGKIKEKNSHDFCDHVSSYRQEHHNLYKKVVIASFKEFSVNYFAAMGQAICQPSSYYYKHDLLRWEENFINSLKLIIDKTKAALNATEYYMYTCEVTSRNLGLVLALKHVNIEDELDLELGGMMQTIIIPEQNLSSTRSCSDNCNVDFKEYAPNEMGCDEIMDCQYISSSYEINYLTNSSRRYSHFIGDNRTEYGDKYRYSSEDSQKSQVASTYKSGGLNWCDYCICTCKKNYPTSSPQTATTISFLNQVSDIRKNKVVTGLKFVKKDHMIQIQILEGQILPYGKVGNESWQSLDKIRYNKTTRRFFHVSNDDFVTPLERSNYGHPQTINLNDVMAPEKHIITGVRFRYAGDSLDSPKLKGGPIELQIRVTPFDFVRGQLINIEQSRWISPKEKVLKDELILENPDNPLYPPEDVEPIITSNKFVKFRVSDLKKDAGQSTVPFFSSHLLSFSKSSLLGGIGLIHCGHPGSGGRIAMKIYDFNISPYFNSIDE